MYFNKYIFDFVGGKGRRACQAWEELAASEMRIGTICAGLIVNSAEEERAQRKILYYFYLPSASSDRACLFERLWARRQWKPWKAIFWLLCLRQQTVWFALLCTSSVHCPIAERKMLLQYFWYWRSVCPCVLDYGFKKLCADWHILPVGLIRCTVRQKADSRKL